VDLTNPDIAVPVVKIVIPGLEGRLGHPDYTPGPRARGSAR
jgi:ribosomal protein S12 methylthiotransferase accessory factor YcaO